MYPVYQILSGPTGPAAVIPRPILPGDTITAEVIFKDGKFQLKEHDSSIIPGLGWDYSKSVTQPSMAGALSSAECIVEAPPIFGVVRPLTNFGTVPFSECLADGKPIGSRGPQTIKFVMTTDGTIKAEPSPLDSNNQSFSVMWENAGP